MNLETRKSNIINWLHGLDDEEVISRVEQIQSNKSDWWNEISQVEKEGILRGIEDVKAGRIIPYDEVKKDIKKWLEK